MFFGKGVKVNSENIKAQGAFHKIKNALSLAPIPSNTDLIKPFYLPCDASKTGIGSVLFQKDCDEN